MSGGSHHDAEALAARLADVESQLREANETLDAIRHGEVDAVLLTHVLNTVEHSRPSGLRYHVADH